MLKYYTRPCNFYYGNYAKKLIKEKKALSLAGNLDIAFDQIEIFNRMLGKDNPYILIGPGRWGTADPWLGIPVNWDDITNAKVIIEVGLDELNPDPSFGSHFFQNLTSLRIGYFTISKKFHKKYIDWDWLKTLKTYKKTKYVNVVKLHNPLYIKLDGIEGEGVILKNNITNKNIMDEQDSSGI